MQSQEHSPLKSALEACTIDDANINPVANGLCLRQSLKNIRSSLVLYWGAGDMLTLITGNLPSSWLCFQGGGPADPPQPQVI